MRKISCFALGRALLPCALVVSMKAACAHAAETPPQWWSDRCVLTTNAVNDFAALNMGQLKHLAYMAWLEMETLSGGAGFEPSFTNAANDYAAVSVGQLKETLRPFCDRLGLTGHYPWSGTAASNDFALANVGQAKHIFCFNPHVADFDEDGLPDQWEIVNDLEPCRAEDADEDADSDKLSNLAEYTLGTDLHDEDSDDDGVWDGEDQMPLIPGPLITMRSPESNATVTSRVVTISGEISFAGTLAAVRVNGVLSDVYDQGNGTYAFTNFLASEDGFRRFVVRAISADAIPLESKTNVTINVDGQSSDIMILSPFDLALVSGASVRVSVLTDSTNDWVTVNGVDTIRDGYVRYAWVTLSTLGTNTVVAVAADSMNRISTNTVAVVCSDLTVSDPNDADGDGVPDPVDPEPRNPSVRSSVTITSPLNGTFFRY